MTERKPGHPDKLFQYCSTDINSIVQRQIRVRLPDLLVSISADPPDFPLNTHFPQFDGERDLRTPQDFNGGGTGIPRMDDMGDDDDDGDAEDSPTTQYTHQDSLKGKTISESGHAVGSKLEGLEVRSLLVSPPLLTHPPRRITVLIYTSQDPYRHRQRLSLYRQIVILSPTPPAAASSARPCRTPHNLRIRESVSS
jgi:hypothetical protein